MNKTDKTQKGQGHRVNGESWRPTPNPGTQKISKKASGPRHALMTTKAMGGWITHKQYPPRRKLICLYVVSTPQGINESTCSSSFVCFGIGPFWAVIISTESGHNNGTKQEKNPWDVVISRAERRLNVNKTFLEVSKKTGICQRLPTWLEAPPSGAKTRLKMIQGRG